MECQLLLYFILWVRVVFEYSYDLRAQVITEAKSLKRGLDVLRIRDELKLEWFLFCKSKVLVLLADSYLDRYEVHWGAKKIICTFSSYNPSAELFDLQFDYGESCGYIG